MEKEEQNGRIRIVLVLMVLMFLSTIILAWVFSGWRMKSVEKDLAENNAKMGKIAEYVQENNQKVADVIASMRENTTKSDELKSELETLRVGLKEIAESHPADSRFDQISERIKAIESKLSEPVPEPEDRYAELLALINKVSGKSHTL